MKTDVRFSTTLHMLMHLLHTDRPMTSGDLAECAHTNPVVIRRTMAELRERGLVTSARGKGGGWELAIPADLITMRMVYEAVGPENMFAFGPRDGNGECLLVKSVDRLLKDTQRELEVMYLSRLAEITLTDLAETAGLNEIGPRDHEFSI